MATNVGLDMAILTLLLTHLTSFLLYSKSILCHALEILTLEFGYQMFPDKLGLDLAPEVGYPGFTIIGLT